MCAKIWLKNCRRKLSGLTYPLCGFNEYDNNINDDNSNKNCNDNNNNDNNNNSNTDNIWILIMVIWILLIAMGNALSIKPQTTPKLSWG